MLHLKSSYSMVHKENIREKYILSGSLDWAEEVDDWPCPFSVGSFFIKRTVELNSMNSVGPHCQIARYSNFRIMKICLYRADGWNGRHEVLD